MEKIKLTAINNIIPLTTKEMFLALADHYGLNDTSPEEETIFKSRELLKAYKDAKSGNASVLKKMYASFVKFKKNQSKNIGGIYDCTGKIKPNPKIDIRV